MKSRAVIAAAALALGMGSVADCYVNAMFESFFGTLECELLAKRRIHN